MNISSSVSVSLMKAQMLNSLMGSPLDAKSDDSWATMFSLTVSNGAQPGQSSSDPLSLLTQGSNISQSGSIKGISASGRNMALFDPDSAYNMMTVINKDDVLYKAQFSELSEMGSYVSHMQGVGESLDKITLSTADESIKSRLQAFVTQYNNWIKRFDSDVQRGGLLADTQAAQASRFELEQNVNNRFFGIQDGLHGMGDIGITIDTNTKLAALDNTKLDSVLATNKQGVVDTLQEFSANFAKSASLLNAKDNFILKQLDNLGRAIHYIADNRGSLQQEFGLGDTAKPTGQVAQALAAYNQTYGI